VLGEVEETIYTVDEDDEGGDGEVRTVKKQSEMLFVRGMHAAIVDRLCARPENRTTFANDWIDSNTGDSVVLISPQQ